MEYLDDAIIESIKIIRKNKRQPNESLLFATLLKTIETLEMDELEQRLDTLVQNRVLNNKPYRGSNSYYVNGQVQEDDHVTNETENHTSSFILSSPVLKEKSTSFSFGEAENDIQNQINFLHSEFEALKLFIQDQVYILKKPSEDRSTSKKPDCDDDKNMIANLQNQNKHLLQENATKNTIIQILVENQKKSSESLTKHTESPFQKVKGKSKRIKHIENQGGVICSNRYEKLYTSDESDESDYSSATDSSPSISTSSFDSIKYDKRKSKNTHKSSARNHQSRKKKSNNAEIKNVESSNVRKNGKRDRKLTMNNGHIQHESFPLNGMMPFNGIVSNYSDIVERKPKNIIVFSDSMLKDTRMGEFNKHLRNGKAHLKVFTGVRASQLDYHTIPSLDDHVYDIAAVHVGVNDLLQGQYEKNVDIDKICSDIKNIGMTCRSYNISKILISSVIISQKITNNYVGQLNSKLREMCRENAFYFIDNRNVSMKNVSYDKLHLLESGTAIVANNLIYGLNRFLDAPYPLIWNA